jgi:PAS domain S-box-containing protein
MTVQELCLALPLADTPSTMLIAASVTLGVSMEALRRSRRRVAAIHQSLKAEIEAAQRQIESLEELFRKGELQQRLLVTTLGCIDDFAYIFDERGRFLFANQALLNLWGFTLENVVGKNLFELGYPDELAVELHRQVQEVFISRQKITGEVHYTSPSGVAGYYEHIFAPAFASDGSVDFVVGSTRDISARKQDQDALRRNEEMLRLITNLVPNGIFAKDSSGRHIFVNTALARIAGLSVEEILGKDDFDLVADKGQAEVFREHDRHVTESGTMMLIAEEPRTDLSGRTRYLETIKIPFNLSETGDCAVLGVCTDVTEQRQMRKLLEESEGRYRALVEWSPESIIVQREGKVIYANPAAIRMMGAETEQDLVGKSSLDLIHPDYRDRARQRYRNSVEHGNILPLTEETLIKLDGTAIEVEVQGISISYDGAPALYGSMRDITERKRLEATILESEEKFRTMVNSIPQLAWIARTDGYILWFNQRWYEYTGTTPEQVEGRGWQSLYEPVVLPMIMEKWQGAIDAGEPFEMESPLRGADGKSRIFLTRVQPLKDGRGRVLQWFGTNTDVDELKQAEEKIQQANNELERRVIIRTAELEATNKELEAFSYSVSHDLRAPLRAVNGFAGIVMDEFGSQMPADALRYLNRICNGAKRMGELIDDLLAFSRLGRQSLNPRNVDTVKLVQEVLDESAQQWEGRQIDIRVGNLPACHADAALLRQVWVNLISNAIKYTGKREAAVIEIGCERENNENVFFVRDNGTGFNMQYSNKLFGVFQRLHRADEFEGTGVGLAIAQRIVHRHGGRIWADAVEGRGATFCFSIKGEEKYG